MKAGYLSEFFPDGVAAKALSAVEAEPTRSNQHEFNGVTILRKLFGENKHTCDAKFIYLNDTDDPVIDTGFVTWYDARERHATRSEHRLYFPTTQVSNCMAEGDLLVIGRRPDGTVLVLVVQGGSTLANQVLWLFNLQVETPGFSIREELESEQDRVEFASRFILEELGVTVEAAEENYLDEMLKRFKGSFPNTRDFSGYARSVLKDVDPLADADAALMSWMEKEEILFRTLEKHLLAERLAAGFKNDVDGFVQFSLSVQNRRKSRVGFALENHLEAILKAWNIRYERGAPTEGKAKPDFVFPGRQEYRDPSFSAGLLTMLAVKSTCKDRWRQVLAEAARINPKHLLTLEMAITTPQTDQMMTHGVQLVLPKALHRTYRSEQCKWLMCVKVFLEVVLDRQARGLTPS
jgi:hypothetical protein